MIRVRKCYEIKNDKIKYLNVPYLIEFAWSISKGRVPYKVQKDMLLS